MCQDLGPLDGQDTDALVYRLPASPAEAEVHGGLLEAFPRTGEVPEGLDGEGGAAVF